MESLTANPRVREQPGPIGDMGAAAGRRALFIDRPREKLVKIRAKVVRNGRYVTFQMAEVAVRNLFREILSLVDDLRPRPAPA